MSGSPFSNPSERRPKVSVVIPAFNEERLLPATLAAVREAAREGSIYRYYQAVCNGGGGGGGNGGGSGNGQGSSEDPFRFTITKDEYLDIVFNDLELPDMIKKSEKAATIWHRIRRGFKTDGNPSQLDPQP